MEERIAKLMKSLGCSREEALQVIEDDKRIDKGEKLFELSAEQKKVAKESCATGTKKRTVYKFDSAKSKKKDAEKEEFIAKLHEIVAQFTENCEIANANREITFNLGENEYSLVLTKHTKKKK
jgi:hypothetical protein